MTHTQIFWLTWWAIGFVFGILSIREHQDVRGKDMMQLIILAFLTPMWVATYFWDKIFFKRKPYGNDVTKD